MASGDSINFLLLVELIVVVIVASAFLFYWNRLFAWVFAWCIRLYTWRVYNAHISIESLQISPLAGRISFRSLEYHSSNLSLRALHGHVTFRYWKLRVRQEADSQSSNIKRNRLPCRVCVTAEGVEGFVFNRTPAYDGIVERMKKYEEAQKANEKLSEDSGDTRPDLGKTTSTDSGKEHFGARLRRPKGTKEDKLDTGLQQSQSSASSGSTPSKPNDATHELPSNPKPPKIATPEGVNWFRELVPLEIRIVTGSMILGNDATPMLLIGDFKSAEGTLEVSDSRSACDDYKMTMDLRFEAPKVLMRTNVDYSGPLLAHGKKAYDELYKKDPDVAKQPPSKLSSFPYFQSLARKFSFLQDPKFSSPPVVGLPHDKVWKGLARYRLDESGTAKTRKKEEREYAKVTTLLDSPALDLTYYADSPGLVPDPSEAEIIDKSDEFGNVEPPPEYGIDIAVHGGTIKYGPWADRQRDALQKAFAPAIFFHSDPKPRLQPGDTRVHTALLLNLTLTEETTLRIPTREPSKDWSFDNAPAGIERRYGWLDVTVGPNSSITYTQSQLATKHGYDAMLVLHLDSLSIASSVNLETFIISKTCRVSMTMPTPLRWDAQRDWGLDIALDTIDVTLLRDHVQLISDLARDWSSGAVGDFHHFVPNHYNFRVILVNYAFHLYINDFNIVNRPRSREDNAFMDVYGPAMSCYIAVAATQFRPEFSVVPFSVTTHDARVELCSPVWDTQRSFGPGDTIEIGKIGQLSASGNYRYYAVPRPEHQEALTLHLEAKRVVYKMLGWSLRRLFCVKDNYFGTFTQFTTMQEYLERFDHDPESVGDPIDDKYRPGRSDPFSAQVTMNVEESLILLSDQIYGCASGLAMPVPQLQMALRSTNHYLDLSLDALPTCVVPMKDFQAVYAKGEAPPPGTRETFFIEGIEVKAHRLFGPQPRATTYVCIWEINVPRITAFSSPAMHRTIHSVRQAILYTFQDFDNAPAEIYIPKTPPDVTFVKVGMGEISMTVFDTDTALSIHMPEGINVDTSTWATRAYQAAIALVIPKIALRLLSRANDDWITLSSIDLDLSLNVFNAPRGWHDHVENQQAFIRAEDGPTGRVKFMYTVDDLDGVSHADGQYLPTPWTSFEDYEESEASSMSDAASAMVDLSSSMGSDGEASPERRSVRPRSRARSWATARQGSQDSLTATDVSDTSTETGSTSGDSAHQPPTVHDMPGALAESLARFKGFQQSLGHAYDGGDLDVPTETLSFGTESGVADGRIVRILLRSIRVDAAATAVISGARLFRSLSQLSESPERLLDNLLLWQIRPLITIVKAEPFMVDVTLPRMVARVTIGDSPATASALDIDMRGVQTRVLQNPTSEDDQSKSDIMVAARTLSLAVTSATRTGKTYLESTQSNLAASFPNRVFNVSLTQSQVAISPAGSKIAVHHRYGNVEMSFVNSALDVVSSWLGTISGIRTEIADFNTRPRPYVAMLYRICRAAEDADITLSVPQFMSETAYGLHIQDQRSMRQDLGWILLAKLRHWYRLSGHYYRRSDTPNEDMARDLVRGLASMEEAADGEEALIARQGFIQHALGSLAKQNHPGEAEEQKATNVMLYVGDLKLQHHGPGLEGRPSPANLVHVTSASFGVHLNTHQRDAMPASNTRMLVALKSLELDLHNSLLPLADHLQPLKDALPKPRPEDDTQQAASRNLLLDLQCETMKLGVSAAGLKGSITLEKHHTSLSHRAEARRRGSDLDKHHQTLVMLDSNHAEVAVFQPQIDSPDGKGPVDRMVILVGARGHEIVLETHDHFDAEKPKSIKVVMGLQHFEVDSRPQIRHFLTFAREWKTQHFPTYAPYLRRFSRSESSDSVDRPHGPLCAPIPAIVQVDLSIHSGQIQIRAAKAVWLRWELAKIFLTQRCTNRTTRFGIKIAPQLVGAYESPKKKDSSGAVLRLPSIAATGTFRLLEHEPQLSTSVQLGFFTGIIKPAMLDRLLLLHQRLGRDMEQLIKEYAVRPDLSASTSASSSLAPPSPRSEAVKSSRLPIRLEVRCGIEGVRFGLRADDVATTLLFEALALTAQASNTHDEEASLSWRAKANHFGLSLGHLGTGALSVDTEPMKKHRSAYMVLDVDVQEIPASETTSSKLNVYLNRVHTVMHIAALSELSDLVKSWQSDLHILRDNRATEVAEVKHTTSRFFKKLDPGEKSNTENSWFATRLLSVHVAGLGLAIPLLDSKAISSQRKEELHGVPALLFSIRTIDFMNRRNETARFKVQRMALQFINKFDQGVSEHFSGDFHPSSNRMSLPTLESEAQMSSKEDAWTLSAHCAATDFRLSLAPDVADGVFRLMDLYEQGRDRFLELERNYRSEDATATERLDSVALKYDDEVSPISPRKSQRIIIRMSYTFNSGIVELHRLVAHELKKTSRRTNWLDIFHLPTISLWVDFEGAKTESLPHTTIESDAAQLIFSCAVHESRNTLRPSILPFFVELTNRIQQRVRQNNQSKPSPPKEPKTVSEPLTAALSESTLQIIAPSKGAVDVRVSLRIDRSELRFSCAPDSNAYADLKWESGGFLATTTLGKPGVSTVAGSISDITSTLSHEFAESGNTCVEAGAKDMAFAVTLCPGEGPTQSGVSVVFDTQLSGQFRLDAFSSWLIFIAVWVDNAPQLDILDHHESTVASSSATPAIEIPTSASQVGGLHQVHRHKLAVAILARFRCIDFDANIGVSRTHLEISPILLRTTSNGERTEVDVRVGTTKVSAKGDISGELTSQGLVFNTMRRSSRASSDFDATVLSMAIEGGDLSGSLFLADTNILRFHLEPTTVSLADDWQAFTRDPSAQVFLSFTVKAGLFQGVLRLLSIPRLLGNLYSIIDMAESQSVIAAQRSEIFKSARSRRKTEPSPVAAILLQSAAKKVASSPSTVKTAQTMRFDLAGIDVGLFNEDYEQGHVFEFYRFIVGKVEADLKRQLSKDHLPTRDLGLLVAFVRWDNSDGARVAAQEKPTMTAGEMIEAATRVGRSEVASLPVMTLVMNSIEYNDPPVLDFDFDLTWGETDGDVKILPSFFEQAYVAFDKLIKGLDEQEMARAKRSEPEGESATLDTESYTRKTMDEITSGANAMEFRNRDPTKAEKVPIPRLKMLGEGTGDAAKLVPKIRSGVKELPKLSHRFVTLPLEEGMDLLLKLYEKQLPETAR